MPAEVAVAVVGLHSAITWPLGSHLSFMIAYRRLNQHCFSEPSADVSGLFVTSRYGGCVRFKGKLRYDGAILDIFGHTLVYRNTMLLRAANLGRLGRLG